VHSNQESSESWIPALSNTKEGKQEGDLNVLKGLAGFLIRVCVCFVSLVLGGF